MADVSLDCPQDGRAPVGALCAALRDSLGADGHVLTRSAALRLVLEARMPNPQVLTAYLAVHGDGPMRRTPTVQISVMDRQGLPAAMLYPAARRLVEEAGLASPGGRGPT